MPGAARKSLENGFIRGQDARKRGGGSAWTAPSLGALLYDQISMVQMRCANRAKSTRLVVSIVFRTFVGGSLI